MQYAYLLLLDQIGRIHFATQSNVLECARYAALLNNSAFAADHLMATYKYLHQIEFCNTLPGTATGKVLKADLSGG